MQCPSCNKFPAKDTDSEPEGELDVDVTGMVTGDVRIVNNSECCGDELEEASFSVEIDLSAEVAAHRAAKHPALKTPKKKVALKPLKLTDPFAMCRNCKRGYRLHVDPATRKQIGEHPTHDKWPADARKCRCTVDWMDQRGMRGTRFEPKTKGDGDGAEMELSVDADMTRTDETQTTDRRGKKITNPRYMRRLYGIHVDATVKCETCNEDIASGTFVDSVAASGMESLV